MSDVKQLQFGQRLRRIEKAHKKLGRGAVVTMTEDGLLVAKPQPLSAGVPLRGVFMALCVLLGFKAFLFSQLGEASYQDRIALLESGSTMERMGAYVMKVDPVTVWLSGLISESGR